MMHAEIRTWFNRTYSKTVALSTVKKLLSTQYSDLDTIDLDERSGNQVRQRDSTWPALDKALVDWVHQNQERVPLTGELITEQAQRFWTRFKAEGIYDDNTKEPKFTNGWIDSFKKRHGIKCRIRHGEAGSVDAEATDDLMVRVAVRRVYCMSLTPASRFLY